jgi:hypothetical protein
MGLDLYAMFSTGDHLDAFEAAAAEVIATCGTVDGGLMYGNLDTSRAIGALRRACGNAGIDLEADFNAPSLPAARLAEIAERARFSEDEEPFAALSARAFIKTCAALHIGAYFG